MTLDPQQQRAFAHEVVARLRQAGYAALWAGGCVRDERLGRVPKDYDVASDARPDEVRRVFKRTFAIGAAFGVISVVGPPGAGQIDVATFRRDAAYADGRHPESVSFSSPEEDARRRDFTINGMFFDPLEGRLIDYVGGAEDLAARRIRAIGDPLERFAEDKLRLLRAVRFAAAFDFQIEPRTRAAIGAMAAEIGVVSAERIAMELRRMLVEPGRVHAVEMLIDTGLAATVFPELVPHDDEGRAAAQRALAALGHLAEPGFPLALAALVGRPTDPAIGRELGRRWRLSNKEVDRLCWLLEHRDALAGAAGLPWSKIQPILAHEGGPDLAALHAANCRAEGRPADDAQWALARLDLPRAELDPPLLASGNDLLAAGIAGGPPMRTLLQRLRAAQLDGQIATRAEAIALARRLSGLDAG